MKSNASLKPLLKWVGGKRLLYKEISSRFPKKYNKYIEPFLGGGAILFLTKPKKAVINDINTELINVYNVVKNKPNLLIKKLSSYKNDEDLFYKIRNLDRNKNKYLKMSDIEKASRIIFLNKTCYNGLYRVNSNGELNSPFGKYKNPNICDEELIINISKYFNENEITILNNNYYDLLKYIKKGDFVYLDPPYDPISCSSSFTGYTASGFSKNDQKKLKEFCDKINKKGAYFLLSNSNTEFINDLYKEYKIDIIKANRFINSDIKKRNKIEEVLIRNYD